MSNSENEIDTAVILVAGVGSRLRPLTDDRPKALVDIGGETIFSRAVGALKDVGVRHFVLATGYREDQIASAVAALGIRATLCPNADYAATQNSVSLGLCAPALAGKSFFKLDGDVVFQREVLERLLASPAELAVAVDSRRALDAEAMKVSLDGVAIRAFGKALALADAHAETIGIELLRAPAGERVLSAITHALRGAARTRYYEDFYSDLVAQRLLSAQAVETGDLAWSEVDTFEDLERARQAFRLP